MAGFVYLIRNGDLHKIGRTDNLKRRLKQLQPCTVVQTLETNRSRDLEHELHKKFKSKRIPQTEYFRLTDAEVEEVRVALGWVKPSMEPVPPPLPTSFNITNEDVGSAVRANQTQKPQDQTGPRFPGWLAFITWLIGVVVLPGEIPSGEFVYWTVFVVFAWALFPGIADILRVFTPKPKR